MRLLHISDLHLGKTLYGYALLEEQKYALDQVIQCINEHDIDVLIIAGDVYDKTNPSNGAIQVWNDFLNQCALVKPSFHVVVIAGNHDSFTKLDYGSQLFKSHNIHIWSKPLDDHHYVFPCLSLKDEYGPYHIYGTPFVRPMDFPSWKHENYTYTQMMTDLLDRQEIDPTIRNIWVSHQFFVNTSLNDVTTSDSETSVLLSGGLDAIALADMVLPFDYMAFGHLHTYQQFKDNHGVYSGSIYPYSLSEITKPKQMVMVEIKEKDDLTITPIAFKYQRQVRLLSMDYQDILANQDGLDLDDYVAIELPRPCADPLMIQKLSLIYPHLLSVTVASTLDRSSSSSSPMVRPSLDLDPLTNISALYKTIYDTDLSNDQIQWLRSILKDVES